MKKKSLTIATLQRIERQMQVGDISLKDIAREYHLTGPVLSIQMCNARKKGLLPPAKRGRRPSLQAYGAYDLTGAPKADPFNPSDVGDIYDRY